MDISGRVDRVPGVRLALYALAVVLVLFAEGVGWQRLVSLFGGTGGGLTEVFQLARIFALTAGTAASVWFALRGRGFLGALLRAWVGVVVTWGVVGGLAAAGSFVIVGDDAGELLRPFLGGFVLGVPRGLLLGWVVALPAAFLRRSPRPSAALSPAPSPAGEPSEPAEPAESSEPAETSRPAGQGWRSPFLVITGLIWVPVVALGLGAQLFASDVTPDNCPSLCFSDRDGIFFLIFMSLYGLVPMWLVQLAALALLRLNTRFRGRPVAVQVILVLAGGLAILIAVTAPWTFPVLADWIPSVGRRLLR